MRRLGSKPRKVRRASREARPSAPSRRNIAALAARLRLRLGAPVQIEIQDNTYTMLSFAQRNGRHRLRLHHMFQNAPDTVLEELAAYIRGGDPAASGALDDFIEEHRHLIRRLPIAERQQRFALKTQGSVYDLQALLDEVRDAHFPGEAASVAIAWAPAPKVSRMRRSIKLGSYSADSELIRIHPALDQSWVPAYFVRWIVYHELLHHRFREELKANEGCVHPPHFRRQELLFPQAPLAMAWERRHLERLLSWQVAGDVAVAS